MFCSNQKLRILILVGSFLAFVSCSSSDFSGGGGTEKPAKAKDQTPKASPAPSPSPSPVATPPVTTPPKDELFIGGSEVVFHIGDGKLDPSSACYSSVSGQGLEGTTFIFSFDVLADAVATTLSIDYVCGTDIGTNTGMILMNGGVLMPERPIPQGAPSISFGTLTLNRGRYEIVVKSAANPNGNDFDDFLVGKIRIQASKSAIKVGTVTAR